MKPASRLSTAALLCSALWLTACSDGSDNGPSRSPGKYSGRTSSGVPFEVQVRSDPHSRAWCAGYFLARPQEPSVLADDCFAPVDGMGADADVHLIARCRSDDALIVGAIPRDVDRVVGSEHRELSATFFVGPSHPPGRGFFATLKLRAAGGRLSFLADGRVVGARSLPPRSRLCRRGDSGSALLGIPGG